MLVEKHMADSEHLALGDTLQVFYGGDWHDVTVLGTVTSAEYLWPSASRQDVLPAPHTFGVIFASESLARTIAAGNGASGAEPGRALLHRRRTRRPRGRTTPRLTSKALALGAASTQTRADQPSNAALGEDISGFPEMAYMFPMLFLGAAGLATYVVLTRRVGRDRQIIGMMRANGYRRRAIMRHYLGTGLLVGTVGSVLGAVAGVGLAGVITKLYTAEIGVPSAVVQIRLSTGDRGIVFGVVVGRAVGAGTGALRLAGHPRRGDARDRPGQRRRTLGGARSSGSSRSSGACPPAPGWCCAGPPAHGAGPSTPSSASSSRWS